MSVEGGKMGILRSGIGLFIIFAVLSGAAGCENSATTSSLAVDGGAISGTVVVSSRPIQIYKGIPFAAPPVGNLRWKPPQPVVPWSGTRACTQFGPSCPQPPNGVLP